MPLSCGLCQTHKLTDTCSWRNMPTQTERYYELVNHHEQQSTTQCNRWYNRQAVDVLENGLLWLSPFVGFGDSLHWLRDHKIQHVLCMANSTRPLVNCMESTSYTFSFAIDDTDEVKLPLNDTTKWIHERLEKKEPVLVTCLAGINRSVSIVIGYLIQQEKNTLEEASNRCGRLPVNRNFLTQLHNLS